MYASLLCIPPVADPDTTGLRFGLQFEADVLGPENMSLQSSGNVITAGFDLNPAELQALGAFLIRHAKQADEYLRRYQNADEDPFLLDRGQLSFELRITDHDSGDES